MRPAFLVLSVLALVLAVDDAASSCPSLSLGPILRLLEHMLLRKIREYNLVLEDSEKLQISGSIITVNPK